MIAFSPSFAGGAVIYWDPQGTSGTTPYTGSMAGTWESNLWSTVTTGTAPPVAWIEGSAACFAVHSGVSTPAYVVTMNSNHTVAGVFDGPLTPNACNVTISGSGIISIPTGLQAFYPFNSADGASGVMTINVPLTGVGTLTAEGTGTLNLNGTNTYTGATLLGYSGKNFTGTLNFNNTSAFGTGSITLSNGSGCTMSLSGTLPVTVTNAVSIIQAGATLNLGGNVAGVTYGGPWSIVNTNTIGVVSSSTSLVNISGPISGSGGFIKNNSGILMLSGTNTYTGPTSITGGILAIGASGSISNTPSLLIAPGASGSVFDVSAVTNFTLSATTTLYARGSGTSTSLAANIKGAAAGGVSLGSQPLFLNFTPSVSSGDVSHPSLYVSQGLLNLSNNNIIVTNSAGFALGAGTYRLIQVGNGVSGVVTGAPNSVVTVYGNGLTAGSGAFLSVSNGDVNLIVKPKANITGYSVVASNTFGVGSSSITVSGKVSLGSIYPAPGENLQIIINGITNLATVNDTTGDFSLNISTSTLPYSGTQFGVIASYPGNSSLSPSSITNNQIPVSYQSGGNTPGFFSGINFFFTNLSGVSNFTWSTSNPGLPVTDWLLEGQMQEQVLTGGTNSRYSINVVPATSNVYYICGTRVGWPYVSPTTVQWITTDDNGNETYFQTNMPISSAGVFAFPLPPAMLVQPTNSGFLAGQNARLNATVTGSQPMYYQWYFNTNTAVNGILTNVPLLTFTNVSFAQAGRYFVTATNQYGSVVSSEAVLTILPVPSTTAHLATNGITLSASAVPGSTYYVQTTTNILNPPAVWKTISTNIVDGKGVIQFQDLSGYGNPQVFYRFVFP